MPKDYAQTKRPKGPGARPRAAANNSSGSGSLRALLLLAGIGLVGYLYINRDPSPAPQMTQRATSVQVATPAVATRPAVTPTPVATAQPAQAATPTTRAEASAQVNERSAPALTSSQPLTAAEQAARDRQAQAYQFYRLTQETPEIVDVRPPSERSIPLNQPPPPSAFIVQAASFRSEEDALQLRAELILAGIPEARVQSIETENGLWYRVVMGPLDSRSRANAIARRLQDRNLRPLVRQVASQ